LQRPSWHSRKNNAVGADADPSLLPADANDQRVLFWWKCGDPPADEHDSSCQGSWTTLKPQPKGNPITPRNYETRQYGNFHFKTGGFGPEIGLARSLLKSESNRYEGSPAMAILKVAYSGTSVENDWNPDLIDQDGNCLRELIDQFDTASSAAQKQGYQLKPKALIWVQGESDSMENRITHYQERLTKTLGAIREALESPQLEIRLAVNTRFQPKNPERMSKVVAVHEAIASNDPHCKYVDTSSSSVANDVHFDAAGTLDVGHKLAESLMTQ
jgi:Carbohydrate esterase, sialic acid-specific acetylesterase